jgi:hypothetical protein
MIMKNDKPAGSPIKKSLLFLLMALMVSAALITTTYFPYSSFVELEKLCTEPTTGTVTETCSQEKLDSYYYGPTLEYTEYATGRTLRASAVNTVNLNCTWKKGEALSMYYNPSNPSQLILRDNKTAINRFNAAKVMAMILSAVGIAAVLTACMMTFVRSRPKKFKSNIAGESFEEWQSRQNADSAEEMSDADLTAVEKLDGRVMHQADLMDSVQENAE